MAQTIGTKLSENPYYVLGLRPGCGRTEVEREGQKLLGMLALGVASAQRYATPLGEMERTPERVREAMAELRDPAKREAHAFWARLDPEPVAPYPALERDPRLAPWDEAFQAFGWRAR